MNRMYPPNAKVERARVAGSALHTCRIHPTAGMVWRVKSVRASRWRRQRATPLTRHAAPGEWVCPVCSAARLAPSTAPPVPMLRHRPARIDPEQRAVYAALLGEVALAEALTGVYHDAFEAIVEEGPREALGADGVATIAQLAETHHEAIAHAQTNRCVFGPDAATTRRLAQLAGELAWGRAAADAAWANVAERLELHPDFARTPAERVAALNLLRRVYVARVELARWLRERVPGREVFRLLRRTAGVDEALRAPETRW